MRDICPRYAARFWGSRRVAPRSSVVILRTVSEGSLEVPLNLLPDIATIGDFAEALEKLLAAEGRA
jgi:hypothetical protein